MNNKDYWNRKIIEWEDSMKQKANISMIETLASYIRKPLIQARSEISLQMLDKHVRNKHVLELGCGSGFFAFELYNRCNPKHIAGIDISNNAIERAQKIASNNRLTNKITFLKGDAIFTKQPQADITVGLGFLDYLSPEEIKTLFENISSPYFFFSFVEKKISLLRYIQICYLWSQRCTDHYYYNKNEIRDYIGNKYNKIKFFNDRRLSFACMVHNLP